MTTQSNNDTHNASLGFETKLWDAADLLRSNMDPAEYKHVVLGLLFLKYISDVFEERRTQLAELVREPASEYYVDDPNARQEEEEVLLEDRDEYTAENVFWVPAEARWSNIQANAQQPIIGKKRTVAIDQHAALAPDIEMAQPHLFVDQRQQFVRRSAPILAHADLGQADQLQHAVFGPQNCAQLVLHPRALHFPAKLFLGMGIDRPAARIEQRGQHVHRGAVIASGIVVQSGFHLRSLYPSICFNALWGIDGGTRKPRSEASGV